MTTDSYRVWDADSESVLRFTPSHQVFELFDILYLSMFICYFMLFVYCNDIDGHLVAIGLHAYHPSEWRLFIHSSKRSLKCVLLHNRNIYGCIPIGHSVTMKDEYGNIKLILEQLKYGDHQWLICGDLKMLNFLLGQQGGYTQYPCFLCYWDSKADKDHWVEKEWLSRHRLIPGEIMLLMNH